MSTYAIGDLQGCFDEFEALLARIGFRPDADRLLLVGDLVNRGPGSLPALRWVHAHRDNVDCVLGNHDLHLLAVSLGLSKIKGKDTLGGILAAPDAPILLGWLRTQPLVRKIGSHLMVHAGLLPQWSTAQALACSDEVQAALTGPDYREFMSQMYGNKPDGWDDGLKGWDRLRAIVNTCTRMRMLTKKARLDFDYKGELADAPDNLRPWFDFPHDRDETVLCGHWSALGLLQRKDVIALDTGCVWGGKLTAVRLEDGVVYQERSRQPVTDEWN